MPHGQELATPHPGVAPGISGHRFLPVVLLILALLCGGIAYFVLVVNRMEHARSKTADVWRQVALKLDQDYQSIEHQLAQAEDGSQFSTAQHERFASIHDQFRTAVDLAKQRELADQMERFLQTSQPQLASPSSALREQVRVYNETLAAERSILQSIGGRIVRIFLVVPELEDFQLGR